MITDSLTMGTIIVVVFTAILVIAVMIYSHQKIKKEMRILSQRTILMSSDDEISKLCKNIMDISPNACPLLDGDASHAIRYDSEHLKAVLKKQLNQLKQQS